MRYHVPIVKLSSLVLVDREQKLLEEFWDEFNSRKKEFIHIYFLPSYSFNASLIQLKSFRISWYFPLLKIDTPNFIDFVSEDWVYKTVEPEKLAMCREIPILVKSSL